MANITITNNDLGSCALEVWGVIAGTLQNVEITDQTYLEGTLLVRNPANGNLVPFAPAAVEDTVVDVTVDFADIPTLEAIDQAVVVAGSLVGDLINIEPLGTWPVGITLPQGRCLVAGTVQVRVANVTAGNINPGSQAFRFSLNHDVQPPQYVLTHEKVVAASSSSPATVLAAGKVNQNRLKVHGAPPTAATAAHLHALLNRPIIPVDIQQLAKIDNPQ